MRIFWFEILLIFLPFLLYRLYIAFIIRKKVESGGSYNELPISVLFLAGLLLAIVSFVIIGLVGERVVGGEYVPPKYEDGEIIPPRID